MNHFVDSELLITFANASIRSLSLFGGDSWVVLRYAVRSRSVERSSKDASVVVEGAGVCEADDDVNRGSVVKRCVHCQNR